MGLAIYNSTILDIRFPPYCYKKLLFSPNNRSTAANSGSLRKTIEVCGEEMLPSSSSLGLTLHDLSEVMPVSETVSLYLSLCSVYYLLTMSM